jgi:Flp pilus assembly protein TadB
MTDDLSEAYADNERRIGMLCQDCASDVACAKFEAMGWGVVMFVGDAILATLAFWDPVVLWAAVLLIIPFLEIHRARRRMKSREEFYGNLLEACFVQREYLKSRLRGF